MVWQQWLLVILISIGIIGTIAQVGEPRKPITSGFAAFNTIVGALLILAVITI